MTEPHTEWVSGNPCTKKIVGPPWGVSKTARLTPSESTLRRDIETVADAVIGLLSRRCTHPESAKGVSRG